MTQVSPDLLRVAACQMRSTDDQIENQNQILQLLKNFEARDTQVDLVSFPENSLYFRIRSGETVVGISEDDPFFEVLGSWAKRFHTYIHLGSVALRAKSSSHLSSSKLLNATVWINPQGEISFPYSKIHLFDVDVVGEKAVRESEVFAAGEETSVMQINDFKIGLSICYDLRFSDLYLRYAKQEVDLILIPSAFLVTTGQAHWHSLMRARAIEAQAYVVAAAQGGEHASKSGEKRFTYGHSLIVGPWGDIISEVKETGFIVCSLDKKEILRVRKQIPMKNHRRL